MQIVTDLRLIVPIRMMETRQRSTVCCHIFQTPLPPMAAFISGQPIQHRLVCRPLQIQVKRCINLQSTFMHLIAAVSSFQISPDFFDIRRSQRSRIMRHMQLNRLIACLRCFLGSDLPILQHGINHQVAPFQRSIWMCNRRVVRRPLG